MQQPALPAQQTAIRDIRSRYERGDIDFERFEYALNALIQAQTPAECQAIINEIPSSPITALDALPSSSTPAPTNLPRRLLHIACRARADNDVITPGGKALSRSAPHAAPAPGN